MSRIGIPMLSTGAIAATAIALFATASAEAGPIGYASGAEPNSIFEQVLHDDGNAMDEPSAARMPEHLRRQVVTYRTGEAPGTIVIDTPNTQLYYVLGDGHAIRYGIGVGREGFTWSGVQTVTRKTEWPDWIPPAEMIERQPYLPRFMAGGPSNPLGARAMYLGGTVYRIHGTNAPETIGGQVSSGCIRLVNQDVIDLYSRVSIGAKVVVLPASPRVASVPTTRNTARSHSISESRPAKATRATVRTSGLY